MNPTEIEKLIEVIKAGNQLKRIPRTGWDMRGIPNAENVAAHSYGVAYICLILAPYVPGPINVERLLTLAILHDLPESLTTDIPAPVWKRLPAGSKAPVEQQAMDDIFEDSDRKEEMLKLWKEVKGKSTPEAMLVADADKVDLYLQCTMYEQQFGNQLLDEFWTDRHTFFYDVCQSIYDLIRESREHR